MKLKKSMIATLAALALGATGVAHAAGIEQVMLISVDGLHALDVARYMEHQPNSAFSELASHATTYTNARIPAISDSFPGLLALVTGGSPISHGLFYDVSYDRTLFDPSNTTCAGAPGNTIVFDESVDAYDSKGVSLDVLNPAAMPRGLKNGVCVPLYPHDFIRTNTVFEVVKRHGGRTAWADKHPVYDLVNGPSGKGVDDLYTPEITSAPPGAKGPDASTSVVCTVANDRLKVEAILHQINGKTHNGRISRGIPTVFGMNFQAVSVGQKLAFDQGSANCPDENDPTGTGMRGRSGGYLDGTGTPTEVLQFALDKTDNALKRIISELKKSGKYDSTLVVISSKHGQSPINPVKLNKPGSFVNLVASLPDAKKDNAAAKAIADAGACKSGPCGFVQDDDVVLIWLEDQKQTEAVARYLNQNASALFVDEVLWGTELQLRFNDPALDSRTPDIIVQPQYGTVYTASKKKIAEHGGMSYSDTNVALMVSNPRFSAITVKTPVSTAQVAPTILRALKIDPKELDAVKKEHTPALPNLLGN